MMNSKDKIALNFFPLVQQDFKFTIYRHPYLEGDKKIDHPECSRRRLPNGENPVNGNLIYTEYWVAFTPHDGFEAYTCNSFTNIPLTVEFLYQLLKQNCVAKLDQEEFSIVERGFRKKMLLFVLKKYPEGNQTVWLEPYFLRIAGKFGFLADFKFQAPPNAKVSRHVQQLSLSLDSDGRSNTNFYTDHFDKLQLFISKFYERLFPIIFDSQEVSIQKTLLNLESNSLKPKKYEVARGQVVNSQFNGVKNYGPLRTVSDNTKVYFVYREQDKPFSYDLVRALRGNTFKTFPGMEKMFRYKLTSENIGGIPVKDFSVENLEEALTSIQKDAGERPVVPILITPFNKDGSEEASRYYHLAKYTFLKHRVPTQFVSLEHLQLKNQLKWSVSNIGLQLFAKMGGQPWKVVPQTSNCLIIGLGQSHKRINNKTEKFFAYSILTESTGLYKDLKVLSKSTDYGTYINNFRKNLTAIFEQYQDSYDHFVVHATFSIRGDELDAVKEVLDKVSSASDSKKEFLAIKFNDKNKFFGYSVANNSMVPYESSYLQLSQKEFLVWFEGLQYHNPNIRKRIERPLHIEFIYPNEALSDTQMQNYLQDAVNLSGANWRGFNAKSLPVSVYYAHLVAGYFKEFQALGLEGIDLEAINPWFL